ncbi:MAG: hypothetical protein KAJ40_06630 [Alphaproteobacteria bacterium]|nr:hypothetical protein [Alphaproteobacteria bacterium]
MEPEDLRAALEAKNIEPLDNQSVANDMANGVKIAALGGTPNAGKLLAQMQDQMPKADTEALDLKPAKIENSFNDGFDLA